MLPIPRPGRARAPAMSQLVAVRKHRPMAVWGGRTGQWAFEYGRMANVKNNQLEIQNGFVALFDIMGFGQMIANNNLEKSAKVVFELFQIVKDVRWERCELATYNLIPECFIFSDSILVYQMPTLTGSAEEADLSRSYFIKFCGRLTAEFLVRGLPVKGAIGKGEFAIIEGKSFTGKCIIDAHALSESLQCAGCAVVPTLESEFSKDGETLDDSFQEDLLYWQAPLKNSSPQKLLMLNFLRHVTKPAGEISRTTLIEKFSAHGKGFDLEVLKKVSETEKILAECKKRIKPD